jgi:hypothetical protein
VETEELDEPVKVYNFEVEGFHTYFVGATVQVLVHNACNGTYGEQGGHHPMAKSAFEGNPLYSADDALTLSNGQLNTYGTRVHQTITGQQHALYSEFAKTGEVLTMETMAAIETQAMVNAGVSATTASSAVGEAVQQLLEWGITGPTRIPWG